jgi:hypothetical protein
MDSFRPPGCINERGSTKKRERKSFTSFHVGYWSRMSQPVSEDQTPIFSRLRPFWSVGNWLLSWYSLFELGDFGVGFPIKTTAYILVRC